MLVNCAFKTAISPNNKQRTSLLKHAGASRFAWNWALARRKSEYESTGKASNAIEQHRQLNALKPTEFPWMYDVSKCAMQEALRDLDRAYQNFWRGLESGKRIGFPRFKSKKNGIGSFHLTGSIHAFKDSIQLPRLGLLRLKEHGYIPISGIKILSAICSERVGRWFVSVSCEMTVPDPQPATGKPLGVDLGIKTMATVSDSRKFENPKALSKAQKKMRRLQRELSRREEGSQNREKTRWKIAKTHDRIASIRKDALHKATSAICAKTKPDSERPSAVVVEGLNIAGLVRNRCLARAVSDAGMGEFRRQMEYKTAWAGERLIVADRFFPSSKTCSLCSCINNKLTLADREWTCDCGAHHDRDLNAAINLSYLATKYRQFDGNSNACGQSVSLALASRSGRNRNQTSSLPCANSSRF